MNAGALSHRTYGGRMITTKISTFIREEVETAMGTGRLPELPPELPLARQPMADTGESAGGAAVCRRKARLHSRCFQPPVMKRVGET